MYLTSNIRRLNGMSAHERKLVARTVFWLWFFRLRDITLPFWLTKKWISEEVADGPAAQESDEAIIKEVTGAIRRCRRYVPGATCLTKALATRAVLRHYGQPSSIRIGVARSDVSIDAHAWVEVGGRIVFGRLPNVSRYSVMRRPSMS